MRYICAAILALAAGLVVAPTLHAGTDASGFVTEMLACGPWRDMVADQKILGRGELAFEGHATLGQLWTPIRARGDGFFDLAALGPASNITAAAFVYVQSPKPQDVVFLVGADDRAHLDLNDRRILTYKGSGGWKPDQEKVAVRLPQGWSRLLVRAENDASLFGFSLRVTLPDGRPLALETSIEVPEPLLDDAQLKRPLSREEVDELLGLLRKRISSANFAAETLRRTWRDEGEALDPGYADARRHALEYTDALEGVLRTMVWSVGTAEDAKARQAAEEARRQLHDAVLRGPARLTAPTETFLAHAEKGSRLWAMIRFAASTVLEAGQQAAEVDRALVAARTLIADLRSQYLRPWRLREQTLRCRTAEFTLRFTLRDGTPLAAANVSAEQLAHHFLFGCNLFAFQAFPSERENELYLQRFQDMFNLGVVPVYWSLVEPREGSPDFQADPQGRPGPEAIVRWCGKHRISVMATPLVSGDTCPLWLRNKSADETSKILEQYVRGAVGQFKGRVDWWDLTGGDWPNLNLPKLRLPVSYLFRWAREADPGTHLATGHAHPYYAGSAASLQKREPFGLDAVVLSAWQGDGALPPEELESRLNRTAQSGVPIIISQVMIPGPARDEEGQARAVEDFYRTAFASPGVRGIVWWDLSDRFALRGAPGGLLREDLSAKPAYRALDRLIHSEWWTALSDRADEQGAMVFRGFFGRYRIRMNSFDANGAAQSGLWQIDLTPDGPRDILLTWPPEPASVPPRPAAGNP